ncbi:hypothetical protein [Pseudochryseolinea flava]|uniref:Secretion system C-terminal sorting domain-containing protein n=1 Tax=Pseudochryseolinea flava TaxID=2059302 RepID=A0A364XXA6_9BACT|nr:hypothetical protein [Pseudochryseolinea flava]RAV98400.1 hypothetical protein DQQ10_24030 [Pseudochryseolinea flava]
MKKILSMIVAIAISGAVFANNSARVSGTDAIVTNNGANVKLYYKSQTTSKVVVSIYNESHKLVFSETVHQENGFARPYNFSNLEEGTYTIDVNDGGAHYAKQVTYKKEKREKSEMHARLTQVVGETGKYILSIPKSAYKTVTVKIYNESNRLTYSAEEQLDGDFAKVYNIGRFGSKVSFEVQDAKGNVITVLN